MVFVIQRSRQRPRTCRDERRYEREFPIYTKASMEVQAIKFCREVVANICVDDKDRTLLVSFGLVDVQ